MLGPLRFELPGVIGRVCAVVSMLFVSVRAGSAQTNTIITFTNNLGDVIVNATVMRRDGDKLLYRFGNSGGTIRISDLPGELRKRFGSPQETAGAIDFNAAIDHRQAPAPVWIPTPEQRRLQESLFFKTRVDEFEGSITHTVVNLSDLEEMKVVTLISRSYRPMEASSYEFMIQLRSQASEADNYFGGDNPLMFLVDGTKFTFEHPRASSEGKPDFDGGKWTESYFCGISEELVRSLGKAKSAKVRVPCYRGAFDHAFSQTELDRFAIFNRAYMPANKTNKVITLGAQ